ncbi:hypothetical protein FW774_13970 [Pedobacter sp. BS3]|uniref:hypothetical protein n=1 Tax=Pedobacter sp. BS3 TaxID=2567937 RepID=UPI0011EDA779|nr:hypothetical protein [Pedobacter sp. BS3]TZF82610.1 hypothetical protein FW774_13970 [Pedobacter sp. BS3]
MSKSKNAKFAAPKGKPSGNGKEGAGLNDAFGVNSPESYNGIREKYTSGNDEPASNVHTRHVNRPDSKHED